MDPKFFNDLKVKGCSPSSRVDEASFVQTLCGMSYPIMPMKTFVHQIVDIGANWGAAALWFWSNFPKAKIDCFEPNPKCWIGLEQNISICQKATIHPFALHDHDGKHILRQQGNTVEAFLGDACDDGVEVRHAGREFERLGLIDIDILKIDAEGSDVPIMRALDEFGILKKSGLIYIEYHHAEDRLLIDDLLRESHWLFHARSWAIAQGEVGYVRKDRI